MLREIIKFRDINGVSPTIRELMPLIGVTSTNGVKRNVDALLRNGRLTTLMGGGARAIVPVVSAAKAAGA